MKKMLVIIVAMFMMTFTTQTVYAQGEFYNAYALLQHWEKNGYPDYVGSIFSTDGSTNLTILLVDDDGSKEDEIRSMLRNTSGVSFGTGFVSHNDLLHVHKEIVEKQDPSIHEIGIGWTNIEGVSTGFGESKKEFRVIVGVDEHVFNEYETTFHENYGDIVYVEVSTGPELVGGPAEEPAEGAREELTEQLVEEPEKELTQESAEEAEEASGFSNRFKFMFLMLTASLIMAVLANNSYRKKQRNRTD